MRKRQRKKNAKGPNKRTRKQLEKAQRYMDFVMAFAKKVDDANKEAGYYDQNGTRVISQDQENKTSSVTD